MFLGHVFAGDDRLANVPVLHAAVSPPVIPDLIRDPLALNGRKEGGCRVKPGMTS
jgi:hypothetical protein